MAGTREERKQKNKKNEKRQRKNVEGKKKWGLCCSGLPEKRNKPSSKIPYFEVCILPLSHK